jgi:hypothetical protein
VLGVLFGGAEPEPTEPPSEGSASQLLEAAAAAFAEADSALRSGDLARYQQLIEQARVLVDQALELLGSDEQASRLAVPT